MKTANAGVIVLLLMATCILMASFPTAKAYDYAPPYDYSATGGYHKSRTPSFHYSEAYADTGTLRATASNYYISGNVWDAANAWAEVSMEHQLASGQHLVYYSYYIHGSISSPVVPSAVRLSIYIEVWRGWWIFWRWDQVTEYVIVDLTTNYVQLSQSGSYLHFWFNAPDNYATYRVKPRLYVVAPASCMGVVNFGGYPDNYALVSVELY